MALCAVFVSHGNIMTDFILSAFADEGGKTIEEQIAAMKANDITHIEPRGINGVNISDFTADMAKELKKTLNENGVGISAIGSPFGKIQITDDFAPHFDKFKRGVENALILGAERIRIFSFYMPVDEDYAPYRDEVMERLTRMCDYSRESGVWCCHENEKGIYGDTDDRCLDILTSLEGKIKGVFDPANFVQCSVQILPAYEKLGKYIDYLHIKDALYADGSIVPPGKGEGCIAELLKKFAAEKKGDKILTLEPHLKVFDGLKDLEQAGGTEHKLKNVYTYKTNLEAFSAAASALKDIIASI